MQARERHRRRIMPAVGIMQIFHRYAVCKRYCQDRRKPSEVEEKLTINTKDTACGTNLLEVTIRDVNVKAAKAVCGYYAVHDQLQPSRVTNSNTTVRNKEPVDGCDTANNGTEAVGSKKQRQLYPKCRCGVWLW